MQNIYYILVVTVIIMVIWSIYSFTKRPQASNIPLKVTSVKIKNTEFMVEIADTEASRQKGLMQRNSLPQDKGMLFVFDKTGIYPFWMKDTLIPLDMIGISEDKKITYINHMVEPCNNTIEAICKSIVPTSTAKYVLEINGGISKKINLQIGDTVEFTLDN